MKAMRALVAGLWVASVAVVGGILHSAFAAEAKRLSGGPELALTNDQANASWDVSGALFWFPEAPTGAVSVARTAGGVEFVLSVATTNGATMAWFAESPVPVGYGEALRVRLGGSTGIVDVIRVPGK